MFELLLHHPFERYQMLIGLVIMLIDNLQVFTASSSVMTSSLGAAESKLQLLDLILRLNTKPLPTLLLNCHGFELYYLNLVLYLKSLLFVALLCDNIRAIYLSASLMFYACAIHTEIDYIEIYGY